MCYYYTVLAFGANELLQPERCYAQHNSNIWHKICPSFRLVVGFVETMASNASLAEHLAQREQDYSVDRHQKHRIIPSLSSFNCINTTVKVTIHSIRRLSTELSLINFRTFKINLRAFVQYHARCSVNVKINTLDYHKVEVVKMFYAKTVFFNSTVTPLYLSVLHMLKSLQFAGIVLLFAVDFW